MTVLVRPLTAMKVVPCCIFLTLTICNLTSALKAKFTKLECFEYDKPFATIPKCYLKALSRYRTALNVHVALHQVPVNNVSFNGAFYQKSNNGYRPLMYNNTVDFCSFYKNPNRFVFWKIIFFNIIAPSSNINHTCPYNHDIIVKNLILDGEMFRMIPFPPNEYSFRIKVAAYNHDKAEIRANVQIME
ncbi:uncharacterized protein LOC133320959 [Musca vetustissima]|uniref:uncharacterized protein LOC133320959 n=1 Tax=Musca vetustissima TaxID=27455 RepID=UPI002AB69239|nr:uncharacterized protein LOC133320959 [Musca vetustissima]